MIEGKLTEMGREPRNVQVYITEDAKVILRDAQGPFVEVDYIQPSTAGVETDEVEDDDHRSSSNEPADSDDSADIRAQNELLAAENERLTVINDGLTTQVNDLNSTVNQLEDALKKETDRVNEVWRMSCTQLSSFDEAMTAKEAEILTLKSRIGELEAAAGLDGTRPHTGHVTVTARTAPPASRITPPVRVSDPTHDPTHVTPPPPVPSSRSAAISTPHVPRRAKAPPLSEFSGEETKCTLDDWLPSLERASTWNCWSDDEKLIQLAGHLKSRALQEWNLLLPMEKSSYASAIEALRSRLDFGNRTVAAQDFRHTIQDSSSTDAPEGVTESVSQSPEMANNVSVQESDSGAGPLSLLFSDSDDDCDIKQVMVTDYGSLSPASVCGD